MKTLPSVLQSINNGGHVADFLLVVSFLGIWYSFGKQCELGCRFFEKLSLLQQTDLKQSGSRIIACKLQRFIRQLNASFSFGLEQIHAGEAATKVVIGLQILIIPSQQ